jgi:thiol-disulfide isomerase/thioredoxin
MKRALSLSLLLVLTLFLLPVRGGDLVRIVRSKLSAGDLLSGAAAAEDYKRSHGVDAEYLDAVAWLARGAEMLKQPELAARYVAEVRAEIKEEKPDFISPLGAVIEVEGRLIAAKTGRAAAIRFLEGELGKAQNPFLKSRIRKNINLLSLEGKPALPVDAPEFVNAKPPALESLRGKPVLLFFWANWCGDCKAQAASLSRIWAKYRERGLVVIAPTRFYGTVDDKPATSEEEKARIDKVWKEFYGGLEGVPIPIDTETMIRYGVSATPTFALVDKRGIVRFYTPTRLSEAEMERRIEELLK